VLGFVPLTALTLWWSRVNDKHAARASYADAVAAAVELHRFDILRELRQELPDTNAEEREINTRVARFLGGAAKGARPAEVDLVYHHPLEIESSALGTEVRELRDALAEPTPTNWQGFVSLRFEDPGQRAESALGPLRPGATCKALIAFAAEPLERWETTSLEVSGGRDAFAAEFRVMFDSDRAEFPAADALVVAPADGSEARGSVTFKAPGEPGRHHVWIVIFQGARTVESLEVELDVRGS
jgi:hypothetical protein